jgi:predicted DNA binding CopG/RHH family protein
MNTLQSYTELELDEEEREIVESYERGEWTEPGRTSTTELQEYAAAQFSTMQIHISLPDDDILRLRQQAESLGISLQVLAARIIHGSLMETERKAALSQE